MRANSPIYLAKEGQKDANIATKRNPAQADSKENLEYGVVAVGGDHITVNLENTYVSPDVVCLVQYNNNTIPVVPRVSNVTPTSFDLRLQNPSGGAVASENVSYVVVEEGVWAIDGVNVEAQTYLSTVTNEDDS